MRPRAMAAAMVVLLLLTASRIALGDQYAPDEVIVRVKPTGSLAAITSAWNATVIDSVAGHRIYLLHLNNPSLQDSMTSDLDEDEDSQYGDYNATGENAEARRQIVVIAIGDSTDVQDQTAFSRVHADEAHAYTRGAGSRVAILDTGVDPTHPFLAGHVDLASGYDFVGRDGDAADLPNGFDDDGDGAVDEGYGHGTMVAGIVKSLAPEATLIPIRVLDDEGRGTVFAVLQGLYRAWDVGATIVNVSLGMTSTVEAIENALAEMADHDISVVAAAGNDSANTLQYPARDDVTLAVTAVDSLDTKACFANYSSEVDLSAPGVGVFSAYRDGGYGRGAGTSFSTPFVTGALALLRSLFPQFGPDERLDLLQRGATLIDELPGNDSWSGELGAGRLDCLGAILAGLGPTGVSSPSPAGQAFLAPTPSRHAATLRFDLAAPAHVLADVFSLDGRRVRTIDLGPCAAGAQQAVLHMDAAPGHYVLVLRSPSGAILGRTALVVAR